MGRFGVNCVGVCHCKKGVNCSFIDGVCNDDICSPGWFGSNCQIKIPRFLDSEEIDITRCNLQIRRNDKTIGVLDPKATVYTIPYNLESLLDIFNFKEIISDAKLLKESIYKTEQIFSSTIIMFKITGDLPLVGQGSYFIIPLKNLSVLFNADFIGILRGDENIGEQLHTDYFECFGRKTYNFNLKCNCFKIFDF